RLRPVARRSFWKIRARLGQEGLTILLTTPYLDEAERCTRVALIDHGRILASDAQDALRARAAATVVELIPGDLRRAIAALRSRPEVSDVQTFGERLHVTL